MESRWSVFRAPRGRRGGFIPMLGILLAGSVVPAIAAAQALAYVDVARVVQESKLGELTRREYEAMFVAEGSGWHGALVNFSAVCGTRLQPHVSTQLRKRSFTSTRRCKAASSQKQARAFYLPRLVFGASTSSASTRVRMAVKKLAEDRGLHFVLDDAVYVRPELDLTSAVILEMNDSPTR